MIFLSKYGKDIKINDLSKKLNLPIKTITDGVKFLEKQELIVKKNSGFVIVDLQESTLNKLYKPNLTPSKETIEKTSKINNVLKLLIILIICIFKELWDLHGIMI